MTNPDSTTVDELVQSGRYASKGAARRALGITDDRVPGPEPGWLQKVRFGIAGRRPGLPLGR